MLGDCALKLYSEIQSEVTLAYVVHKVVSGIPRPTSESESFEVTNFQQLATGRSSWTFPSKTPFRKRFQTVLASKTRSACLF